MLTLLKVFSLLPYDRSMNGFIPQGSHRIEEQETGSQVEHQVRLPTHGLYDATTGTGQMGGEQQHACDIQGKNQHQYASCIQSCFACSTQRQKQCDKKF